MKPRILIFISFLLASLTCISQDNSTLGKDWSRHIEESKKPILTHLDVRHSRLSVQHVKEWMDYIKRMNRISLNPDSLEAYEINSIRKTSAHEKALQWAMDSVAALAFYEIDGHGHEILRQQKLLLEKFCSLDLYANLIIADESELRLAGISQEAVDGLTGFFDQYDIYRRGFIFMEYEDLEKTPLKPLFGLMVIRFPSGIPTVENDVYLHTPFELLPPEDL